MTDKTQKLFYFNSQSTTPTGYCHGLLMMWYEKRDDVGYAWGLAEATALRSPKGQPGKIIRSGLAATSDLAQEGVMQAVGFIDEAYGDLRTLFGAPYIDWECKTRYGHTKEGYDMLLRVPPPECNASSLASTMVVAIIAMLWQKPPLDGWSVVGNFSAAGRMFGYPIIPKAYLLEACKHGVHTALIAEMNRTHVLSGLAATEMSNPEDPNEKEKTCRLMVSLDDDGEEKEEGGEDGGHEESKASGSRRGGEKVERVIKVVFCGTIMEVIAYIHEHAPGWA